MWGGPRGGVHCTGFRFGPDANHSFSPECSKKAGREQAPDGGSFMNCMGKRNTRAGKTCARKISADYAKEGDIRGLRE